MATVTQKKKELRAQIHCKNNGLSGAELYINTSFYIMDTLLTGNVIPV
jgi:hypothetical protein